MRSRAGVATAVWGLAFAALSFSWAAGGRLLLGTLDTTLQDEARARELGFVVVLWSTGVLKLLIAALGLAVVRPWKTVGVGRLLRMAAYVCGGTMALYGLVGAINGALAEVGAFDPVDANAARWYLLLWGPVWLAGGLLLLASARQGSLQQETRSAAASSWSDLDVVNRPPEGPEKVPDVGATSP